MRVNPNTFRLVVVAMLAVFVSALPASAQSGCPASPAFSPDFSSNQSCMALNSSATFATGSSTSLQLTSNNQYLTGSAWYTTPQSVSNGFTTTFQFQFTNSSSNPADGIAFVIQNASASTAAIGDIGNGGPIGYGDDDANTNPSLGEGIPNSLAIEFDTFQNAWDPAPLNGVESQIGRAHV